MTKKIVTLIISIFAIFSSFAAVQNETATMQDNSSITIESEPESAVVPASAEINVDDEAVWDEANTAYINANYHRAIELYHSIEERGLASEKLSRRALSTRIIASLMRSAAVP